MHQAAEARLKADPYANDLSPASTRVTSAILVFFMIPHLPGALDHGVRQAVDRCLLRWPRGQRCFA
jgi:hypothetical protein